MSDHPYLKAISDKIAVMDKGKVLQVGTPMEVYKNPSNDFVANFVGTSNTIQKEEYLRVGRVKTTQKYKPKPSSPEHIPNKGSGCPHTQVKPNYLPTPSLQTLPIQTPYKVAIAVEHRRNLGLHITLILASPTLAIFSTKELLVSTP